MRRIDDFARRVRKLYQSDDFIPLHAPTFQGNEKQYLEEVINSTFVSSVGSYVDDVELFVREYCNVKAAVAVVNGTSGLQVALNAAGVGMGDEVVTQALSFVATANSIAYNGASPVFVDVDRDTMGMSPTALNDFLENHCQSDESGVVNTTTGNRVAAVVPMHTFGFLCRIVEIRSICEKWNLPLIEDAAEALGSYGAQHAGTVGDYGVFSFNGNKVVTSGGGGMVLCNSLSRGKMLKHLTTTAKVKHPFEYVHDQLGFNFRMPNVNAALLLAQLESLNELIHSKERVYEEYKMICSSLDYDLVEIPSTTERWNHWLFSVRLNGAVERDEFLNQTNELGVMTRPIWKLLFELPMYSGCIRDDQENARFLAEAIVNVPSSAR